MVSFLLRMTLTVCFRFSGVTEESLHGVTTTIHEVQAVLLSMIHRDTILVGHSLESDLKATKVLCAWLIKRVLKGKGYKSHIPTYCFPKFSKSLSQFYCFYVCDSHEFPVTKSHFANENLPKSQFPFYPFKPLNKEMDLGKQFLQLCLNQLCLFESEALLQVVSDGPSPGYAHGREGWVCHKGRMIRNTTNSYHCILINKQENHGQVYSCQQGLMSNNNLYKSSATMAGLWLYTVYH